MKRKFSKSFFAAVLALCVLSMNFVIFGTTASAEKNGTINVIVDPIVAGVKLGVYEVGTYDYDTGYFELKEGFAEAAGDNTSPVGSTQALILTNALAEYAVKNEEPDRYRVIDDDGNAEFKYLSVDNKAYLICQMDGFDCVTISPMLTVLPYKTPEGNFTPTSTITAKYDYDFDVKGAVILNKVDGFDESLEGAVFKFEQKKYVSEGFIMDHPGVAVETDVYGEYIWELVTDELVTDEHGQIVIQELPRGTYVLTETKAPDGYVISSDPSMLFDIVDSGTVRLEKDIYVPDEGDTVTLKCVNLSESSISEQESSESSESSEPSKPSEVSYPSEVSHPSQVSTPQTSRQTSITSTVSTPKKESSFTPVLTGEDIAKFIIIGVVVAVSLVAVILLFVLGKKKKDDDDDE